MSAYAGAQQQQGCRVTKFQAPLPDSHGVFSTRQLAWPLSAVVLACLLAGCGKGDPAKAGGPPGGGQPPEVGVITVSVGTVPLVTELPGRVEAVRTAQVRARVTGIVQERLFREGSDVKAGQPLFRIDPAPYRAAADSAQAAVVKAQANLTQTAAQAARYKPLLEANAISKQEYVNAQAAQGQAEADVAAAKAALRTAQLNLGYATVTAPISGRIGRALVTEGALVSQAEATQLALIQQISPVYVNFTQSVADLQKLRHSQAAGQVKPAGNSVPVRIVLDDGSELKQAGRLLFSDLTVDATSGQVTLRAEVPNADMQLLPGMYVRGRLSQAQVDAAILVPQQAVTRSPQGDTVMVITDGKPVPRPVKLGGAQGNRWLVLDGLKAGEQLMVDGFQKLRPGVTAVKPVPWSPAASGAAPSASVAPAASAASR